MSRIAVAGESLIDIVRDESGSEAEHVGGSPLNVALGLAALGHEVDFATTYGPDVRGRRIREHVTGGGVRILPGSEVEAPTSTALALLDSTGAAEYAFDLHWDLPPISLDSATGHLHTGSLGALLKPGGDQVRSTLEGSRATTTTSYDPNIRPSLMGPVPAMRSNVEDLIALSDVVKASSDDVETLYPGEGHAAVLARWCDLGVRLAVLTLGAEGVVYRMRDRDELVTRPSRATRVLDTVGAGDSFMAGLLSGLVDLHLLGDLSARARLDGTPVDGVRSAVERGLACAARTVAHRGAYAPSRDELDLPSA